ncbi:hypothetical protein [Niastella sp. OAS944]|uniref:hypothetical protein n=1 Tax=Niastella sp. OAS944 TaxID=2664089 RepID=UPI0034769A93|nr:hypothetical protein [Chitinophagaceae bacterium OAS944]
MKALVKITTFMIVIGSFGVNDLTAQVRKSPAKATVPAPKKTNAPGKKSLAPIKAAPLKSKIVSVAKATKNEILIRWAPGDEGAWTLGNKYGYALERFTIARDGKVLDRIQVNVSKMVFKPRPLATWDTIATKDDYAAILAQAIYGDDFEVTTPDTKGVTKMINKTQQLTQRFNMSMYAADHSFEAAEYAGLAFRDKQVKLNEKYFYRIYSLIPGSQRITDTSLLYIGLADYAPLPKPSMIIPEFGDKTAILKWDFDGFKEYYTSYIIERSADGGKTFQSISDKPVTNLNETDPKNGNGSMMYIDGLPGNDTVYQYRIAGLSLFGETGPYSDIAQGKGKTELALTPHISGVSLDEQGTFQLAWEFEDSLNNAVKEFQINQAPSIEGPYTVQQTGIAAGLRATEVKSLFSSNYITITVVPKEGESRTSQPYLLQPEDSIAPAIPTGFKGTIDSNGVVVLKWDANTEKDLAGYKILKANVKGHEFTPVQDSLWKTNEYRDTVNLKNLNPKVYYTIRAVDTRYNQSDFTRTLEVIKPDVIPPSAPVLAAYDIMENGIRLQWVNSSDSDVIVHKLYRRLIADTVTTWILLQEFRQAATTEWTDKDGQEGRLYSYTIIAMDSSKLESEPAKPLTVRVPEKRVKEVVKNMEVEVDRKGRTVTITWEQLKTVKNIRRFELFRGEAKEPMSLYKQVATAASSFIDTDLRVNTKYKYAIRAVYTNGQYSDFVTKSVIY